MKNAKSEQTKTVILQRNERVRDSKRKTRVLIRFSSDEVFESFTYDISNSGIFVIVKSAKVLQNIPTNQELKCFLEIDFNQMIEFKGIISRVNLDEQQPENNGFAIEIMDISDQNKVLLQTMIATLR
ncbi:MAG: hypothetical protein ACD_79C00158G0004 [uncultured bacterium]|nr:MAG: hypothetical protein ACD_79C00158G0004 [uncultured bacterium]